jgi:hypothetical protein
MNPDDKKLFLNLLRKDYAVVTLALTLVGFLFNTTVGLPVPATLVLALLAFTAFDAIGYESVAHSTNRMDLVRYRVIQTHVQWIVFILCGALTHWNLWACVGYILLWWMGVCDVLFYVLLNKQKELLAYEGMPWLWWTPIGIINSSMGRQTSGKMIYSIAIWTTITWFSLLILFPSLRYHTIEWSVIR